MKEFRIEMATRTYKLSFPGETEFEAYRFQWIIEGHVTADPEADRTYPTTMYNRVYVTRADNTLDFDDDRADVNPAEIDGRPIQKQLDFDRYCEAFKATLYEGVQVEEV